MKKKKSYYRIYLRNQLQENSSCFGVGGNNTKVAKIDFQVIKLTVLSVSPYYNKPTQMGLIEHYKVISSATDLPILLYNVPGRTLPIFHQLQPSS